MKVMFCDMAVLNCHKALFNYREEYDSMCGGSPLFYGVVLLYYVLLFRVGENTGEEIFLILSFSPL